MATTIDIKKLFVRVASEQLLAFKQYEEAGALEASKIYFLADGRIWTNGQYFGISADMIQEIYDDIEKEQAARENADTELDGKITDEKDRAEAAEQKLSDDLKQEVSDREDAIDALRKEILGSEDLDEALKTIKQIQDWIHTDDAEDANHLDEFFAHVKEFSSHVEEFEGHVQDFDDYKVELETKTLPALEEKLQDEIDENHDAFVKFVGTEDGSFPTGIITTHSGKDTNHSDVVDFKTYLEDQELHEADQTARIISLETGLQTEKSERITDIATVKDEYKAADKEIDARISQEITDRANADNDLTTALAKAQSLSSAQHVNIESLIGKPEDASTETWAPYNLSNPQYTGTDVNIDVRLSSVQTVWAGINELKESLANANDELDAKIEDLQSQLNEEETRAKEAEEAEAKRAQAEEEQIKSDLATETERAQTEEDVLDKKIDAETERAEGVELEIKSDLTTEAETARNAEKELSDALAAEEARAEEVEADHESRIKTVEDALSDIETFWEEFSVAGSSESTDSDSAAAEQA